MVVKNIQKHVQEVTWLLIFCDFVSSGTLKVFNNGNFFVGMI